MRKSRNFWCIMIGLFLLALFLIPVIPNVVAITSKTIEVDTGIRVYVDDVQLMPRDAGGNPVDIFAYHGTTYLPVRAVSEVFEVPIEWDGTTSSVYIGQHDAAPDEPWSALPYYWEEKDERYRSFAEAHPDMPMDLVIAYVNVDVDLPDFSNTDTIAAPDDVLVLVTKHFELPSSYAPNPRSNAAGRELRQDASDALVQMRMAMKQEIGLDLYPCSGYRSYSLQSSTFQSWVNRDGYAAAINFSAKAGYSEHQTGLAVDVFQTSGTIASFTGMRFEATEQYQWLQDNAYRYGFILRYPEGMQEITGYNPEAWHYRYVGPDVATFMYENKIALLEEYIGKYIRIKQTDHLDG